MFSDFGSNISPTEEQAFKEYDADEFDASQDARILAGSISSNQATDKMKEVTYSIQEIGGGDQARTRRVLGIQGKMSISKKSIICIPLLYLVITAGTNEVYNSLLAILRDSKQYGYDVQTQRKAVEELERASLISTLPTMGMVIIASYSYEIFGRKFTLGVLVSILPIAAVMFPLFAGHLMGFVTARVLLSSFQYPILLNPLISDYVVPSFRGRAWGLAFMGILMSQVFSFAVLQRLSYRYGDDIGTLFVSAAGWLLIMGMFVVCFMIKEPVIYSEEQEYYVSKQSFCQKVRSKTVTVGRTIKEDPSITIGAIGFMIAAFQISIVEIFYLRWIDSFIPCTDVQSFKQGGFLFNQQMILSNLGAMPLILMISKLSDAVSPKYLVPTVYLFRSVIMCSYVGVTSPGSTGAWALSLLFNGSTAMEFIVMLAYMSKRLPKTIRAMMYAYFGLFIQLGFIAFQFFGQYLSDNIKHSYVFLTVGICDALYAIILIILVSTKKLAYKQPDRGMGVEDIIREMNKTAIYQSPTARDEKFHVDSVVKATIMKNPKATVGSAAQQSRWVNAMMDSGTGYAGNSDDDEPMVEVTGEERQNLYLPVFEKDDIDIAICEEEEFQFTDDVEPLRAPKDAGDSSSDEEKQPTLQSKILKKQKGSFNRSLLNGSTNDENIVKNKDKKKNQQVPTPTNYVPLTLDMLMNNDNRLIDNEDELNKKRLSGKIEHFQIPVAPLQIDHNQNVDEIPEVTEDSVSEFRSRQGSAWGGSHAYMQFASPNQSNASNSILGKNQRIAYIKETSSLLVPPSHMSGLSAQHQRTISSKSIDKSKLEMVQDYNQRLSPTSREMALNNSQRNSDSSGNQSRASDKLILQLQSLDKDNEKDEQNNKKSTFDPALDNSKIQRSSSVSDMKQADQSMEKSP